MKKRLLQLFVLTIIFQIAIPDPLSRAELKPVGRPASKRAVDRAVDSGVLWFSGANFFNKPHDAFAWLDALDPEFSIPREYNVRDVPFSASYVLPVSDPSYDPSIDPKYTDVRPAGPFAMLVTHEPILSDLSHGKYGPELRQRFLGASGILIPISSLETKDAFTSINMGEQVKINFFASDHHYDDALTRPGEYYEAPFGTIVLRARFQLQARGALKEYLASGSDTRKLIPVSREKLERLRIELQMHQNRILAPRLGQTFGPAGYWILQIAADVIGAPVFFPTYLVLASLVGAICATKMLSGEKCTD